jgi:hypothetical protein
MSDLRESGHWLATNPLRRRVGGHQFRVGGLQLPEFTKKSVVFRVGDLGTVEDVVAILVVSYQVPKLFQPSRYPRICRRHSAPF